MYLKWVGSKSSIANELVSRFPLSIDMYIEPFIGSASMYFSYISAIDNCLFYKKPKYFCLSDTNEFLVNCHLEVKNNVDKVCHELELLQKQHNEADNKKALYYQIRNLVTDQCLVHDNPSLMAAYFIYINKTCFNGLWRVNKSGGFNVPFNDNKNLSFDYELIHKASKLLKDTDIYIREFDDIMDYADAQTFVYLDPPYVPLNITSSFTSYTKNGFSIIDLQRLKKLCEHLDSNKAKWMLSNSSVPIVYQTFDKWNISEIFVHRFVKAITEKDGKREKVKEVVITNY